jgi:Domain of Unknown Function (DUF1080)
MLTLTLTLAAALATAANDHDAKPADAAGWTPLFNGKNLDGWYTFLQKHGKNADPDGVVTIEEGAIHLYKNTEDKSQVVMGYIGTEQEYGDYHLRLQFRWGKKKFEPRYKLKRDAGLYYHVTGPDAVWPRGLQYQIEQTNVGDLITLFGMELDTTIDPKTADFVMPAYPAYQDPKDGGKHHVLGGKGIAYQAHVAGSVENDHDWNTVEVIARGTEIVHILNGKIVNKGTNVRFIDPEKPDAKPVPLTKGRILLEIEAAELWFRNVEIRPLEAK